MFPGLVWAGNINVPTIVLTERLMLFSFILIVGLEAWILYKFLPNLSKKTSFFISLKSNLVTMFLVVPFVWGVWLTLIMNMPKFISSILSGEIIENIMGAPWIGHTESLLLAEWAMAPVYFIASYYIEYWFSRKKLKDFDKVQVKKAFFYANLYSYLMIMSFETIYQIIIIPYKATNPYLF